MRCMTLVRFPAPTGLDGARLRAVLEDAVSRYRKIAGLHRKYFLGNDTHGAQPELPYFDLHALVDSDAKIASIDA